jgi:DNA polymerase-3 subunit epsilon
VLLVTQRSFDDLGTPLAGVTFCVLDVETTGASPTEDCITEFGAVKYRGGECLGTLQTLVNPGRGIPPMITMLTGITEAMVAPAPRIDDIWPTLAEFVGGAVIVGHNVRFDLAFLAGAARTARSAALGNRWVDTCALARRLIRDEVRDCRLGTLAAHLRLPNRPTHRALDDAKATADLLHALLERAGRMGVLGLDDLLALPTIAGHPQQAKLRLTADLPRSAGVYMFRDAAGRILYVGKATNLRARVRSYFSSDTRRKIGPLLRETAAVDHRPCSGPLEAAVLEMRLIHEDLPRYNRQGTRWRGYAYLKLTLDEKFPRLAIVRAPRADHALYLGPLPSTAMASTVADAIHSAVPLRRCTRRPPRTPLTTPCTPAQLGVAPCPCAGTITADEYWPIVERATRGMTDEPALLFDPLRTRIDALASAERFEQAAALRDQAAALARALRAQQRAGVLRRSGRLQVEVPGEGGVVLAGGRLVDSWAETSGRGAPGASPWHQLELVDAVGPVPRQLADELACVSQWLDRVAPRARLVRCEGEFVSPLPRLPTFEPVMRK